MLKYLVIQLADDATSYCHYKNTAKTEMLISVEDLKAAIRFGMVENLNIQFVYPKRALPEDYDRIIETIDHTKIMPYGAPQVLDAQIVVCNNINEAKKCELSKDQIVILRISREYINELPHVCNVIYGRCARINVVITDVDKFTDSEFEEYKATLIKLGDYVKANILKGGNTQLNLLTDRLVHKTMNNCNAGDEVITLMPNGRFYPCPGFYYDNTDEYFGDLRSGVNIKNQQLFKLNYAPICRHCDAYHCRRCVWLNNKTTLEVNTPSHEQCVVAHLERNESANILQYIREDFDYNAEINIPQINYLDPFDKRKDW